MKATKAKNAYMKKKDPLFVRESLLNAAFELAATKGMAEVTVNKVSELKIWDALLHALSFPQTKGEQKTNLDTQSPAWAANGLRLCECGCRVKYAAIAERSCHHPTFAESAIVSYVPRAIASICTS